MSVQEKNTIQAHDPRFWQEKPTLDPQSKRLLTEYVGLTEDELIPHIEATRQKAWQKFPYPCIGLLQFAQPAIAQHPSYPHVLSLVRDNNHTLLDLGCCFGVDLRKLHFDGAPQTNLTGSELHPEFLAMGYDFFRDKATFTSPLISGDFYGPEDGGVKGQKFDIVNASMIFHLFGREEQVEGYAKAVGLLKDKKGSMVLGRNAVLKEPAIIKTNATPSGAMYTHNMESFREMIDEVAGIVGRELEVMTVRHEIPEYKDIPDAWGMQYYSITLK